MKRQPKIIISLFGLFVGIFIAMQMKTKVDTYIPATLSSLENTKMEIKIMEKEVEKLDELIKIKEEELDNLTKIANGDESIIGVLEEDIYKSKMNLGTISLKGPGIVISMYDNNEKRDYLSGYDPNDDVIHDIDILTIVNDLRVAGAEAISINNERVVSTSEVFCAGPTIRINKRSSGTPFVIKAIGDPKALSASVNAPGTYGDVLKNGLKKGFDTTIEDSIIIPGYTRVTNFKYGKPVGGEE